MKGPAAVTAASAVAAAVLLGATGVAAVGNAAVYKMPGNYADNNAEAAIYSEREAELNLAYGLQFAQLFNVEDGDDLKKITYANAGVGMAQKVVVVVNGVQEPSEFMKEFEMSPIFEVGLADDRESELFKGFVGEVANYMGSAVELSNEISIITEKGAAKAKYFKDLWNKYFHHEESRGRRVASLWNGLKEGVSQSAMQIERRNVEHITDETFIDELTQLDFFLNELEKLENEDDRDSAVIYLDSLISIYKKTGQTQTYETCEKIIAKLLVEKFTQHVSRPTACTVIVLPLDESLKSVKRREVFAKREALSASSGPRCFSNQLSCIENTDSCSGHGICSLVGSCYQCVCSATYDDEAGKTTVWAGSACEKVDYSAQFHILLWTVIALGIAVFVGVKMLYESGETELPGVLKAATVQTKKNV